MLPPHARILDLHFDDVCRQLSATVEGTEGHHVLVIDADRITALCGARVAEPTLTSVYDEYSLLTASTWPRSLRPHTRIPTAKEIPVHLVLGMRISGVEELLFLVADSFNYRSALGPDAGYVTEDNLKNLLRRLAAFAPNASQDAFCRALLDPRPLPPAVGSLVEFFIRRAK